MSYFLPLQKYLFYWFPNRVSQQTKPKWLTKWKARRKWNWCCVFIYIKMMASTSESIPMTDKSDNNSHIHKNRTERKVWKQTSIEKTIQVNSKSKERRKRIGEKEKKKLWRGVATEIEMKTNRKIYLLINFSFGLRLCVCAKPNKSLSLRFIILLSASLYLNYTIKFPRWVWLDECLWISLFSFVHFVLFFSSHSLHLTALSEKL